MLLFYHSLSDQSLWTSFQALHQAISSLLLLSTPQNHPGSRAVYDAHLALADPTPVPDPRIVAWSGDMASRLGVDKPSPNSSALAMLGGNCVPEGITPFAASYGGFQFGVGRAMRRWACYFAGRFERCRHAADVDEIRLFSADTLLKQMVVENKRFR